jgi:hypothetical protein
VIDEQVDLYNEVRGTEDEHFYAEWIPKDDFDKASAVDLKN